MSKTQRASGASRKHKLVWRAAVVVVLAALWVALPLMVNDAGLVNLAYCGLYAIAAIGLVLLSGYGGQGNFAQPTFMLIGAYTTVNLGSELSLPMVVYIPLAIIISGLIGTLIGVLALRLGGVELAIVTSGVLLLGLYVAYEAIPLTGGENGKFAGNAGLSIGPIDFNDLGGFTTAQSHFWLVWAVVAVVAVASMRILSQRPGTSLMAVRDNPRAASALGVNVRAEKLKAFTYSSALGGLAGALYAAVQQYATPSDFSIQSAIILLAMIVVGGQISVPGAIAGALILWGGKSFILDNTARDGALSWLVKAPGSNAGLFTAGDLMTFLTGLLVILVLVLSPDGLAGLAKSISSRLRNRPNGDAEHQEAPNHVRPRTSLEG